MDLFSTGLIEITDDEFALISKLIYDKVGINLTDKKKSLVKGRLNKLVKDLNFKTFKEYYNFVVNDLTGQSLINLFDKISTNHSYFFREKDHFDYLKDYILKEIVEKQKLLNSNQIKIWCAGCASGEEAYTIAMIINEFFGLDMPKWDVKILATDISITTLKAATEGIYIKDKVVGIPENLKTKYFKNIDSEHIQVSDSLKKMILFKRLNLMNEDFPFKGKFNMIFCRNVMIYFDKETKDKLVTRFYRYIENDGYLFIGHSESLGRETLFFKYIKPALYKRMYI